MKFEFTNEETEVLKRIIDLAVKANGMQVAEAALVLTRKLNQPLQENKNGKDTGHNEKQRVKDAAKQ